MDTYPNPFSPVQSALKFSTVLGTTSARSSITILPADWPPIDISKKTLGLRKKQCVKKKNLYNMKIIQTKIHNALNVVINIIPLYHGMTKHIVKSVC